MISATVPSSAQARAGGEGLLAATTASGSRPWNASTVLSVPSSRARSTSSRTTASASRTRSDDSTQDLRCADADLLQRQRCLHEADVVVQLPGDRGGFGRRRHAHVEVARPGRDLGEIEQQVGPSGRVRHRGQRLLQGPGGLVVVVGRQRPASGPARPIGRLCLCDEGDRRHVVVHELVEAVGTRGLDGPRQGEVGLAPGRRAEPVGQGLADQRMAEAEAGGAVRDDQLGAERLLQDAQCPVDVQVGRAGHDRGVEAHAGDRGDRQEALRILADAAHRAVDEVPYRWPGWPRRPAARSPPNGDPCAGPGPPRRAGAIARR